MQIRRMELLSIFILILYGILDGKVASTLEPDSELSIDASVIDLREKLRDMEIRLLMLEKKETSELESKNELLLKMQEVEKRTLEHIDEISEKVAGVEVRSMESATELLEKLQNIENRFLKVDNHLLMELQEIKRKSSDAFERVRSEELELANTLKEEQKKIENLLKKQNETRDVLNSFVTSQRDFKEIIRQNLSSAAEELRSYVDDRFTTFESIQSQLEDRIRDLENTISELEKEGAILPKLDETVRSHYSMEPEEIHTDLKCFGEPPSLRNGNTLEFERSLGSTVQYECDRDFVMTGNSTVRCEWGRWEGQPPTCVFFDQTFILESTPLVPRNIYCYSDENYKKIQLSRVLDTGRGEGLSKNSSESTDTGKYRFSFTDDNYSERIGAFQCELKAEHSYMKIVTVIQKSKYIADIVPPDPFRVANVGDSVQLEVAVRRRLGVPVKWKHNGVDIPSWEGRTQVEIQNVQTTDAGIYECYYPGRRHKSDHAIIRLIVRNCKENFYGENCDQTCPPCYNGGICHDLLGICVCPAGFTGSNCEVACDGEHFGVNCSKECNSVKCTFRYFCKPDPYGCACAPGRTGFDCRKTCDPGWYGADCKQPCHCANGPSVCNIFNGVCTGGCSPGWTGQSCQIQESLFEVAAQQPVDYFSFQRQNSIDDYF